MRDFRMLSRSRTFGSSCANPITINDMIIFYNNIETDFEMQDYIRLIQAADNQLLKKAEST